MLAIKIIFLLSTIYLLCVDSVENENDSSVITANTENGTSIEEEPDTPIEEIIVNLESACKISERAIDDDVDYLIENIVPETKTQKCFAACWMEKLNIIKKEKFQLERYTEVSSYDYKMDLKKISQLKEILTDCKYVDSAHPERCELAHLIIKCIHDAAIRRGLDAWDF